MNEIQLKEGVFQIFIQSEIKIYSEGRMFEMVKSLASFIDLKDRLYLKIWDDMRLKIKQ